jgi:O-antigen ligase
MEIINNTKGNRLISPDQATSMFWIGLIVWILGFYFLDNCLFGRLSLGNQWTMDDIFVKKMSSVVFALITIFLVYKREKGKQGRKFFGMLIPISALFIPLVFAVLSSGNAPDLSVSSIICCIGMGISTTLVGGKKNAVTAFSILALIQAVFTIYYQKNNINVLQSGDVLRAGGTFNHPNHLYTLMLVVLPLTISSIITSKNTIARLFFMICAATEFCALMLTWYRGGVIGLCIAFVFLAWQITKSKRIVALAVATGMVLSGTVLLHRSTGEVNASSSSRSNASRFLLWKKGGEVFLSHPVMGVGVGNLRIPTSTPTKETNVRSEQIQIEPKNLLLFYLCELGIFGAVLVGLFVAAISARLKGLISPMAGAIGASWVALIIAGVVDTPFGPAERYVGNACFGLLLGLTVLLISERKMHPLPNDSAEEVVI